MTTRDWNTPQLVIAHRGASAYAPENTLAAFLLAAELGADAIELDAKLSRDGQVVVIHDQTTDRTTGFPGRVASLTLDQLRQLDAGASFDPRFSGEKIPALEEVLQAVADRLLVNIELTNYSSPFDPLPQQVVELVRRMKLERRVLFSSFNPIALRRTKRLAPEIPTGLLLMASEKPYLRRFFSAIAPFNAQNLQDELIDPAVVEHWHARGVGVYAWTVNQTPRLQELLGMGVDGVITDVPDLALLARQHVA